MKTVLLSVKKLFLYVALKPVMYCCCCTICMVVLIRPSPLSAQCTPYKVAVPDIILSPSPNSTENRSGVAYNPLFHIYYSVDAGNPTFLIQTYSSTGTLLNSTLQNFDYRGLWWNPNKNQLEGNGYDGLGLSIPQLDSANGYPSGFVKTYSGHFQPDDQSCGAYDYNENVVFFYNKGKIYVYNRKNGRLLRSRYLHNIPVPLSNINATSVIYTGCIGMEIGIYDYVHKRVYLFSAPDGNFVASIQLPANAPARDKFAMAYANNLFWLFDNKKWYSYKLFSDAHTLIAHNNATNTDNDIISEKAVNYTAEKFSDVNTTAPVAKALINSTVLRVTPNPVSNNLHVHVQSPDNNNGVIQIIDVAGKTLIEKAMVWKQGYNDAVIPISSLSRGTYLLQVLVHNKTENIKFVKE